MIYLFKSHSSLKKFYILNKYVLHYFFVINSGHFCSASSDNQCSYYNIKTKIRMNVVEYRCVIIQVVTQLHVPLLFLLLHKNVRKITQRITQKYYQLK